MQRKVAVTVTRKKRIILVPKKANAIAEKPEIAATCFDVLVPASPFLTEGRIERINAGKYEGQEISGALALITKKDRVLELGLSGRSLPKIHNPPR